MFTTPFKFLQLVVANYNPFLSALVLKHAGRNTCLRLYISGSVQAYKIPFWEEYRIFYSFPDSSTSSCECEWVVSPPYPNFVKCAYCPYCAYDACHSPRLYYAL